MTDREKLLIAAWESPEVMALAHAIYAASRSDPREFRETLVELIANYDQQRIEQVASLKEQLIEALMWSVKPMRIGRRPVDT